MSIVVSSEGGLADLQEIRLHPGQASWLLGSTKSRGCNTKAVVPKGDKKECYKQLHWSKDFGVTWNLATTYVVQFDWSLPFGNLEVGSLVIHHHINIIINATKTDLWYGWFGMSCQ
jgi:hypothetical protein